MNGNKDGHPRSLASGVDLTSIGRRPARVRDGDGRRSAVFTSSVERQPGSWPAYLSALGFSLILLQRRRRPVLVLILTSLCFQPQKSVSCASNQPPSGARPLESG